LGKNKPYLSKRFLSIMGILIAIKKNLATDLIAIKESGLIFERKIDLLTNFEDISIDFPKKMLDWGKTMTEVYFNLFIFENCIRSFIKEVSIKAYGKNYWEKLNIKIKIKKKIENRKKNESLYKWLSIRGGSDLYYTDFDELRVIISNNWEIFQIYFPKETWIITYLEDLYKIRNKIAHNIPIEESEKNTVETHTNNIYKQLGVDLKYVTFFREGSVQYQFRENENSEDYYRDIREEHPELSEIDFELIFDYLDMLEKGEIPEENLNNTFNTINRELMKLNNINIITPQKYVRLEEICRRLLTFMKKKDEKIESRVLSILYSFTYKQRTSMILKNQCYDYLIELFENGKYYTNLIRILDLYGYFNNKIETLVVGAIKENKVRLLNDLVGYIDFSRYKDKRKNFIRTLNQELSKIGLDNANLTDVIKKIIRKFEQLTVFINRDLNMRE